MIDWNCNQKILDCIFRLYMIWWMTSLGMRPMIYEDRINTMWGLSQLALEMSSVAAFSVQGSSEASNYTWNSWMMASVIHVLQNLMSGILICTLELVKKVLIKMGMQWSQQACWCRSKPWGLCNFALGFLFVYPFTMKSGRSWTEAGGGERASTEGNLIGFKHSKRVWFDCTRELRLGLRLDFSGSHPPCWSGSATGCGPC